LIGAAIAMSLSYHTRPCSSVGWPNSACV